MKVTIAPDFRDLLPPLTDDESAQLEASVLLDKQHETMPPVIVWGNNKNTIVDGHNQHRLREKHRLKIKYLARDFDTRDDALSYAIRVQLGRRNLSASQRALAVAELAKHQRVTHGGDRKSENAVAMVQLDQLAAQANVSKRTMSDATKVADKAAASVKEAIKRGKASVSGAAKILQLPKKAQDAAAREVSNGHAKTLLESIDFNPPPFEEPLTAEEKLKQWNQSVDSYARKITALKKEAPAGPWWDDGQQSDVAQVLASAAGTARGGKCAEVCPLCNGKGCKPCRSTGFVPNLLYQNMVAKR